MAFTNKYCGQLITTDMVSKARTLEVLNNIVNSAAAGFVDVLIMSDESYLQHALWFESEANNPVNAKECDDFLCFAEILAVASVRKEDLMALENPYKHKITA